MMTNNNKLKARNIKLSATDWAEIATYAERTGARSMSTALREMLQERRNLLKTQKLHDAIAKESDGVARIRALYNEQKKLQD